MCILSVSKNVSLKCIFETVHTDEEEKSCQNKLRLVTQQLTGRRRTHPAYDLSATACSPSLRKTL